MDFLGAIQWAASAIGSQIAAVISWVTGGFGVLFGDISQSNSFLGGALDAIWGVFSGLWGWLSSLWQWINTHIIQQLRDLIKAIHDKLQKIFGPLLAQIRQMIALYRQLWLQYVKPIFDLLQRIRRFLVVFRLLGFKWAAALDARITKIETAISAAFFGVLQNLNTLANWINYIVDPFGVFQPIPLIGGIAQAVGALLGAVGQAMKATGFTGPPGHYSTPAGYFDSATMSSRFATRAQGGLLPDDEDVQTSLRASASSMGYSQ